MPTKERKSAGAAEKVVNRAPAKKAARPAVAAQGNKQEDERHFARWVASDFVRTEEEKRFYYISVAASILGIVWALYDRNLLTAFTFMLLMAVILFELQSKPREIQYEVNMDGVSIGGKLYRFEEIKSFELQKNGTSDVVKLQLKNSLFPVRDVYLREGENLAFMEALFGYFLPEEKQESMLFNFKSGKEMTEDEFIDKKVDEYMKGKF